MKIWIPGSQGLLGSALKNLSVQRGIDCIATSRQDVDITALNQVKKFLHSPEARGITHIINCAAYTNVDQAEKEPGKALLVNAIGPENLGHAAYREGLYLVHVSSDYVFGLTGERPFLEGDPCRPASVYAQTKYEGEERLLSVFPKACILRTSWVFGPGGKNFVSALLQKLQKEEKISVVSDQKNRPTYVYDLAETLLNLACHSGIYHFANAGETSRFEMARKMLEFAKDKGLELACKEIVSVDSTAFPQIAKRPIYSALDTRKVEALLGNKPRSWELALKDYIDAI